MSFPWGRATQQEDCWVIPTSHRNGYAYVNQVNYKGYAHRLAYEALIGEIPEGLDLDHLCRVRNCVNPYHLEPVPGAVNVLRGTGPTAVNARKTHCIHGHEFTEDNIYRENGNRKCRICRRDKSRKWARKNRAK